MIAPDQIADLVVAVALAALGVGFLVVDPPALIVWVVVTTFYSLAHKGKS